ncbi:hypothetical protein Tco_0598062 [Tanacetum coccineum]
MLSLLLSRIHCSLVHRNSRGSTLQKQQLEELTGTPREARLITVDLYVVIAWFNIKKGFLTAKGTRIGNFVKEKGLSMDDGPDVGHGGEASGFVTSNVDNSLRPVDANIIKEDVCNIRVWVKFHDVLITAFTEDGLSAIATKLGSLLMLDSYTAVMCTDSWGRASYARAMIELKADVDLRYTIVVDVSKFSGEGFTTSTIHVEYEWAPPRCSECKVFGHVIDDCPKKIVSGISKNSKLPRQHARGNSKLPPGFYQKIGKG